MPASPAIGATLVDPTVPGLDPGANPAHTLRRRTDPSALASASRTCPGSASVQFAEGVAPPPAATLPAEGAPVGAGQVGQPGFRVLRTIGKGGMGVVYAAEQGSLQREVALKMVLPDTVDGFGAEQRFAAEAVITGRLDHPNIVSVHDLGRDPEGRLYISMKLVRGVSWATMLHPGERPSGGAPGEKPLGLRDHLDILLRVCDAVAFAHAHGVVHRDLKPENVMVGPFGEILVMDWGIALDVSDAARAARAAHPGADDGLPLGTPCYMPPELARGDTAAMGPRTDVFLLGAILYEVLTGHPPHKGGTIFEVLHQALLSETEPARRRAPSRAIPVALEAIAAKALARRPEERHAGAAALADDVRAYLRNEASLELSAAALAEIERQRAVIADKGTAPAQVYGALGAAIAELRQALQLWPGNVEATEGIDRARLEYAAAAIERGDLELAEAELGEARESERRAALRRDVEAARQRLARDQVRRRRIVLALSGAALIAIVLGVFEARDAADERARSREAQRAAALSLARLFHEMGQSALTSSDARSAEVLLTRAIEIDDRRETREALLRARTTGARLVRQASERCGGTAVAIRPDGGALAWASEEGAVVVEELTSGVVLSRVAKGKAPVTSIAWSPDGARLASSHEDGALRVVEVAGGRALLEAEAHAGRAWDVAWSADGRRIATVGEDRVVRLIDAADGRVVTLARLHGATVFGVAFRPDGKELATASWDGALRLFCAETGAPVREVPLRSGWLFRPAYSPDGTLVAVGNDQTTIALVECATGAVAQTLRGHERAVEHVAFSPDGRRLLSSSSDLTVRVWDLSSAKVISSVHGREGDTQGIGVALSPSGRHVALAGFDRRASVWDLEGERETLVLRGHQRAAAGVRWSPDGGRVATSSWDGTLRTWDGASGRALARHVVCPDQVEEIAWGRSGRVIAAGAWDKLARTIDAETGAVIRVFAGHESWIPSVDLSPDERLLATASEDGTARLWETETGALRRVLRGHTGGVLGVAFSPDGRRVATSGADRTVRIWDVESGAQAGVLEGHGADVEGVAWSPDGTRIATGSWDASARVFEAATGRLLARLTGHDGWVYGVAWSPDGARVASASEDGTVRVWDAASGRETLKLVGHAGEVQTVAWSPDGRTLASASYDGTARLYRLEAIDRFLARPPAALAEEAARHTGLHSESLDPLALPSPR